MAEDWKYDPAHDLGLTPTERRRSLRREAGLAGLAANLFWRCLTQCYMAAAHRLSIEGRENLPAKPPYVLVANHSSHLDAVMLGLVTPWRYLGQGFPIAAGDHFFEKTLTASFAAACMNALPIWRKRYTGRTLGELRHRLAEEECIFILFPEGTRSRTGAIGRFKPGLGRVVCGTLVPVVPCCIEGAWKAMPSEASIPRPTKIRLRIGKPLVFAEMSDDRRGWESAIAEVEGAVRSAKRAADGPGSGS